MSLSNEVQPSAKSLARQVARPRKHGGGGLVGGSSIGDEGVGNTEGGVRGVGGVGGSGGQHEGGGATNSGVADTDTGARNR